MSSEISPSVSDEYGKWVSEGAAPASVGTTVEITAPTVDTVGLGLLMRPVVEEVIDHVGLVGPRQGRGLDIRSRMMATAGVSAGVGGLAASCAAVRVSEPAIQ